MSNVQPGDLAMMRTNATGGNRGKLLRVLDKRRCEPGEWRVETLETFISYQNGVPIGKEPPGTIMWGWDSELRRIDNPGDDAQDEMLRPLPKAEPADTRTGQEVVT